ncbi:restriction endonuclease subunit S, partial [Ferruginibacter sp.]
GLILLATFDWLYHQLFNLNLNQYATGTAQPGLSVENLKTVSITVPSFNQQQKIVAQIKTIEEKIIKLTTVINSVPQLKESILKKYL